MATTTFTAIADPPEVQKANPIHGDAGAKFGYDGAIVAGISTYGWAAQAIIAELGEGWLNNGWSETSARNGLLLLMVLFENVHIGNCRSETKSAFVMSPFRSPILIAGTAAAFLIHVAAVYSPMGQKLLSTEPVSMLQWVTLVCLALTVFVGIEIHKWSWKRRTATLQ